MARPRVRRRAARHGVHLARRTLCLAVVAPQLSVAVHGRARADPAVAEHRRHGPCGETRATALLRDPLHVPDRAGMVAELDRPGVRRRPLHRRVHDDRRRLPDVLPRAHDRPDARGAVRGCGCGGRSRDGLLADDRRGGARVSVRRAHLLPDRQGARRAHTLVGRRRRGRFAHRTVSARRAGSDPRRLRPRGLPVLPHERRREPLAVGLGSVGLGGRGRAHDRLLRLLLRNGRQLLAELVDRDRPLPRADAPLRRLGRRRLHDRPRRAAGRGRARRARPAEGRAEDAAAPGLHGAPRRSRDRVRPVHRRQGLVPLDRVRDGDRRAQPHLPRASRLLRHGAMARAPTPPLGSARRRDRRRRLHPRRLELRAVERAVLGRPRPRDRADGEPEPQLHRQRRPVGADRRARRLRRPAGCAALPPWTSACRHGHRRRGRRPRPRMDADRRDLGGEVLERLGEADHE